MSSKHSRKVLQAYRELLGLIRRLPADKRQPAWAEARQSLRQNAGEADQAKQQDQFKQLAARISFLRVVTPKRPGEASSIGAGHYVMRDGKLVEGSGETAGSRCVLGLGQWRRVGLPDMPAVAGSAQGSSRSGCLTSVCCLPACMQSGRRQHEYG